ncbi:MAG: tRNA dihydrouridine synthase DusB [Parachlamydiales bacterium]|nr:tRNA dihydrouridine synthase DusB [Parachlamydiales bacterium]
MTYKKKFNIGSLCLDNNILYAPLAEYTDFSFRKLLRHFHKGLLFCEMLKIEPLVRGKMGKMLKYTQDMKPIGAQLCGTNPKSARLAAKIVEDLGFDVIDLNCGCPVPKVVKDGSGSAMLKTPELIGEIIHEMASNVKVPITVKIRIGWDENSIVAQDLVKIAESANAKAITIHGRTKKQGYSGKANWDYIKQCKAIAKEILVIGNGDLYTPQDVKNIFDQTACDGVMIARGMLKTPWLAEDIEDFFNDKIINKDAEKRKNSLLKYIDYLIQEDGNTNAVFAIRRICGWYLKEIKNIKQLRIDINSSDNIKDILGHINDFSWSYLDG